MDAQETAGGTGEMDDIRRHPRARTKTAKGTNPTSGATRARVCHESLRVLEARRAGKGKAPEGRAGSGTSPCDEFLATHDPPAGAILNTRACVPCRARRRASDRTKAVDRRARPFERGTPSTPARVDELASAKNRRDDAIQACAIPSRERRAEQHITATSATSRGNGTARRANRRSGIVRCVAASGSASEADVR